MGEAKLGPSRAALAPWARHEIGAADAAGGDRLESALLRRLEQDNWTPSAEFQYAVETLSTDGGGYVDAGEGSFAISAENRHRAEIDAFAETFFTLEPSERKARHAALLEQAKEFPAAVQRLRDLGPGLGVQLPRTAPKPSFIDLAAHIGDLFTARPARRAELRKFPAAARRRSVPLWRAAAAELKRTRPDVAALAPDLIDGLIGVRAKPKKVRVMTEAGPALVPAKSVRVAQQTKQSSGGSSAVYWWILFAVLSGAARSCDIAKNPAKFSTQQPQYDNRAFELDADRRARSQKAYDSVREALRNNRPVTPTVPAQTAPGTYPGRSSRLPQDPIPRAPSADSYRSPSPSGGEVSSSGGGFPGR